MSGKGDDQPIKIIDCGEIGDEMVMDSQNFHAAGQPGQSPAQNHRKQDRSMNGHAAIKCKTGGIGVGAYFHAAVVCQRIDR